MLSRLFRQLAEVKNDFNSFQERLVFNFVKLNRYHGLLKLVMPDLFILQITKITSANTSYPHKKSQKE